MTDESKLTDKAIARIWAEEAERRDQAMESGEEPGIPAEEVFGRLRQHKNIGSPITPTTLGR
jgi:hypothetical protein